MKAQPTHSRTLSELTPPILAIRQEVGGDKPINRILQESTGRRITQTRLYQDQESQEMRREESSHSKQSRTSIIYNRVMTEPCPAQGYKKPKLPSRTYTHSEGGDTDHGPVPMNGSNQRKRTQCNHISRPQNLEPENTGAGAQKQAQTDTTRLHGLRKIILIRRKRQRKLRKQNEKRVRPTGRNMNLPMKITREQQYQLGVMTATQSNIALGRISALPGTSNAYYRTEQQKNQEKYATRYFPMREHQWSEIGNRLSNAHTGHKQNRME